MIRLEFEALLEDGIIHVPETIADQLSEGAAVRVAITPIYRQSRDDAWNAVVEFINHRMAQGTPVVTYTWRRDDAYEHLEKPDDPHRPQ